MANYHCSVKAHSRSNESANHAVRSAAYRAGTVLVDEASGNIYNYSYKSEVTYSAIMLPANAPEWASNRTLLWNNVEKSENRVDAQLFREVEVSLPHELTDEQNKSLLHEYSGIFTKDGMIVDLSIHGLSHNKHCHMMLTLRQIMNGEFGNKNREWNDKTKVETWRKAWSELVNKHLAKAGFNVTIDHRSYEKQGLDIIPTVHEGREGIGGHNSEKVNGRRRRNRQIRADNSARSESKSFKKVAIEMDSEIEVINKKLLELSKSVNSEPEISTVKPLASTAMTIYHAPKPKIGTITGIDDKLKLNLPSKPIEAARCYALRALFGTDIDKQFTKRLAAMQNIGGNYSWEAFYIELQEGSNQTHGADLTWWRCYTNMVFINHKSKLYDISKIVPEYADHLNAYAMELQSPNTKVAKPITNVNNPGLTSKPTITNATQVQPSTKPPMAVETPEAPVQFTYEYKGKVFNIHTFKEFKNLVSTEALEKKQELYKDYWKSISLKEYSKRVYWSGSQYKKSLTPRDFDPIDLINCHLHGISPKIFIEQTIQYPEKIIPSPDVVMAIFSGNSKMSDYYELLDYAANRKLLQGHFDKLLVPWWNQFNFQDYKIEVTRIAVNLKQSLRLERTPMELMEKSFNEKIPPSEFVKNLGVGGTGGNNVAPGINHNINGDKPKPAAPKPTAPSQKPYISPTPYVSPSPYSSKKGGGDTPGSW